MSYDLHDTIAAIASAPGGGARGIVRLSGLDLAAQLATCFSSDADDPPLSSVTSPRRIRGFIRIAESPEDHRLAIPGDLLLWPSTRSYTRQPSAEFHTIGSPPLLAAVVEQLGRAGIRPAQPGEFTLRAFVAGRIDLTQAEAVLGVIDARDRRDLDAALDQLAGGLSRPLHRLREELLSILAELEAGLDFVDEDIEFISREALSERLGAAQATVSATLAQLSSRDAQTEVPRVVITGLPNAGKSSLFNALVKRFGASRDVKAIVSPQPGATRDYVVARLNLSGVECELIDTAGLDDAGRSEIHHAAQHATAAQQRLADVELACVDGSSEPQDHLESDQPSEDSCLRVVTKCDLPSSGLSGSDHACSSVAGVGIDNLAARIRAVVQSAERDEAASAATTSARCLSSLQEAQRALASAAALTAAAGDELVAAEIRAALDALGEVVGAICTDDVLDRVFSQFCIGK